MLKKKIEPLNIGEMEKGKVRKKMKQSLECFIAYYEEHGSVLLAEKSFKRLSRIYETAQNYLDWLERGEA